MCSDLSHRSRWYMCWSLVRYSNLFGRVGAWREVFGLRVGARSEDWGFRVGSLSRLAHGVSLSPFSGCFGIMQHLFGWVFNIKVIENHYSCRSNFELLNSEHYWRIYTQSKYPIYSNSGCISLHREFQRVLIILASCEFSRISMQVWKWKENEDLEGSLKLIKKHAPCREDATKSNSKK